MTQAFPNEANPISDRAGMTLRDYFAAKVMQTRDWFCYTEEEMIKINLKAEAKLCYRIADAMMKVRDE